MAGSTKSMLPSCGLYRTTKPLSGHEEQVPAGLLVYFHNHSDSGLPQVLSPDHNVHNRWHFHGPGIEFRGLSWADSLMKMPLEGFYLLKRELGFEGGSWPKAALVQLGYTRNADPILFIAQVRSKLDENDLWFSERGVGIPREQLSILEPVGVFQESTGEGGDHGPANVH
ncbi:MAG TPA: hypothetical protein VF881_06875 [Polyangiaceae bacterium]